MQDRVRRADRAAPRPTGAAATGRRALPGGLGAMLATGADIVPPDLLDREGLADLQAAAGNSAVGDLVSRRAVQRQGPAAAAGPPPAPAAAAPTPAPPTLKRGDGPSEDVGRLQQRLNALGIATPPLRLTAMFDVLTAAAVIEFQAANPPLVVSGDADPATLAQLAARAPLVDRGTGGAIENVDKGNAMGTPEGSMHPTIRRGSHGPAVEELQQKLNNDVTVPTFLDPDGKFGGNTAKGVREFQANEKLTVDGVVGPKTWERLDQVPSGATVGRVEFSSREHVEGKTFGGDSKYTWRIDEANRKMTVTVVIKFTGQSSHPMVQTWLGDIRTVWNRFRIESESDATQFFDLEFIPATTGPADTEVNVRTAAPGQPSRSSTDTWFTNDNRRGLAPHEFGHLIGLDDEYRQEAGAYAEATGEQGGLGEIDRPGQDPAGLATRIRAAATAGTPGKARNDATLAVITGAALLQGAFSQRVAAEYEQQNAGQMLRREQDAKWNEISVPGQTIADDLAARCKDVPAIVNPFLYTNTSLMGNMLSLPNDRTQALTEHDHPVQPRHVRQFVEDVARLKGGRWKSRER